MYKYIDLTRSVRVVFPSHFLSLQETLSELDGFRDFVFVVSSILRIIVIGKYKLSQFVSTTLKKNMVTKLHMLLL